MIQPRPTPAGGGTPPPAPPPISGLVAGREEGAQILLETALEAVTLARIHQVLVADEQIEALHNLLAAVWGAEKGKFERGPHEPAHLAHLYALLLYLNDSGRQFPRLHVVTTPDGRPHLLDRSQIAGGDLR